MMKLIFLGPPGAGKGTQASIVSQELNIPGISTGDMLRSAIKAGTPVGLQAKAFMDEGKLVPDEVIIGIIKERLAEPDCRNGYILDGVPRTLAQAQAMEDAGITFDHVISLEVADEAIVRRMSGRRVCAGCGATYHVDNKPPRVEGVCDLCGRELITRADDKAETVQNRLEIYHAVTEPLKGFYAARGVLSEVDGDQGMAATTVAIKQILGA